MQKELHARQLTTLDIGAASGLVLHNDVLHVIADDGLHLHRYSLQGHPLASQPLFAGDAPLPQEHVARKQRKPDLEALALMPDGTFLALGSGSTAQRMRGCRLDPRGHVVVIDLAPLYATLAREIPALNIEGSVVRGDSLLLAQRGNDSAGVHALIELDLGAAQEDLARGLLSARGLRRIRPVSPGVLDGIPLGLTDLALHPDGSLWFAAAAEDTDNPVDDGVCAGSVIGRFDADFAIVWCARLQPVLKVEGLHFHRSTDDGEHWLLVADADSAETRAPLMSLVSPAASPYQ